MSFRLGGDLLTGSETWPGFYMLHPDDCRPESAGSARACVTTTSNDRASWAQLVQGLWMTGADNSTDPCHPRQPALDLRPPTPDTRHPTPTNGHAGNRTLLRWWGRGKREGWWCTKMARTELSSASAEWRCGACWYASVARGAEIWRGWGYPRHRTSVLSYIPTQCHDSVCCVRGVQQARTHARTQAQLRLNRKRPRIGRRTSVGLRTGNAASAMQASETVFPVFFFSFAGSRSNRFSSSSLLVVRPRAMVIRGPVAGPSDFFFFFFFVFVFSVLLVSVLLNQDPASCGRPSEAEGVRPCLSPSLSPVSKYE